MVKKYFPYIICIVLGAFLFRCNNEVKVAKAEANKVKEINSILERTTTNANKKIAELVSNNDQLNKDLKTSDSITSDLRQQLDKVVSKGKNDLKRFENADNKAWAGYFKEKYNSVTTYTDISLTMPTELVSKVGNDLIKGDVAKAELKIYKGLLDESEYKINVYESLVNNKDEIITQKDLIIDTTTKQRDNLQVLADKQLKSLIKAERRSNFNKNLVPIAVAGGIVAGFLLAN
jgi:DNA primase large subunit